MILRDRARLLLKVSLIALAFFWAATGQVQAVQRTSQLNLQGKTDKAVIANERHFLVEESTVIVDEWGEQIALDTLPVPCQAEVTYRLRMDKDPQALEIKVIDTSFESRSSWSPDED
jgi:hypothetical protein